MGGGCGAGRSASLDPSHNADGALGYRGLRCTQSLCQLVLNALERFAEDRQYGCLVGPFSWPLQRDPKRHHRELESECQRT